MGLDKALRITPQVFWHALGMGANRFYLSMPRDSRQTVALYGTFDLGIAASIP
jgi:hypothetical protein